MSIPLVSSSVFKEVGNQVKTPSKIECLTRDIDELFSSKAQEIFRSCHKGLEEIAASESKVDEFCSGLLLGPSSVVERVVSHFPKEKYSQKIILDIKEIIPFEAVRNLKIITSKFPSVVGLNIHDRNLKKKELEAMLLLVPNLKELVLADASELKTSAYEELSFPAKLDKIVLKATKIDTLGVEAIFSRCQELRSFTVLSARALTFDDFEGVNLSSLRILILKATRLSDQGLERITRIFTLMNELVLINNPCLTHEAKVSEEFVQRVEAVHLEGLSHSFPLIKQLAAAPRLSTLKYINTKAHYTPNPYDELKLSNSIEVLTLNYSAISCNQLGVMISSLPKLTKLFLGQCYRITQKNFEEMSYPANLKELTLNSVSIGLRGLNRLCLEALKIETVILKDCRDLPYYFCQNNLSANDLNRLLEKAWPNLARLNPAASAAADEPFFEMED